MKNLTTLAMLLLGILCYSEAYAQLPILDDFNGYSSSSSSFADWENDGSVEIEWQTSFGGTPSLNTGPFDDVSGGGAYVYMETSSPAISGDQAILLLEDVLIDGSSPALTFAYHMYGTAIGSLQVRIIAGGSTSTVLTITGEQQPFQSAPFLETIVPLIAYAGQFVSIEIVGTLGNDGTGVSYTGDIALDNIYVGDVAPADAAVLDLLLPTDGCALGVSEPAIITVSNVGGDTITSLNVGYWVDGGSLEFTNPSLILIPGESTTVTVYVDLSSPGAHTVNVDVRATGDANITNGLASAIAVSGIEVGLPLSENFDSYFAGTTSLTDLINIDNGEIWETNFGSTPSNFTGPLDDAAGTGGYLYIEASGSSAGDEAILRTPCINLDGFINARLEFDYHMYGGSIDFLSINVLSEGGLNDLFELTGAQQFAHSDPWAHANIDLSAYLGKQIQVRFVGKIKDDGTGATYQGDISLDNILFDGDQIDTDLGATSAIADICQSEIEINYSNFGSATVTSADLTYSLNNGTVVTETVSISLFPGASTSYTFSGVEFAAGDNTVDVSAAASGLDGSSANAFAPQLNVVSIGNNYTENFDSYGGGIVDFSPFINSGDLDWETELGETPSTGTGPSDDASGTGGTYIYMETSSPAGPGDQAILEFCTDLDGLIGSELTFAYHMYGDGIGSLVVEVNGTVEATLTGQQQFSIFESWKQLVVDLAAYDDMKINVRLIGTIGSTGSSYRSDISLDAFRIHGNQDDPIPLSWSAYPGISEIRYKEYDYTKSTPLVPSDQRPVLPDTNYIGEDQNIYVLQMLPVVRQPQTDTMMIFIHGGGFRAGDAANLAEMAVEFAVKGYSTVLIEYPRGYIEGDSLQLSQLTPAQITALFCGADSTAFIWAAATATTYVAEAMDFINKQGIGKYDPSTNLLIENETRAEILAAPGDNNRNRPSRTLLWGTSAGGSIVYNLVLKVDAKLRWGVEGAAVHAGGIAANSTIDFTNTPILAVHNNADPRSPYLTGRAYENETGCVNYPVSQGSKTIMAEFTGASAAPFMLINTCGAGHGYGAYSESFMMQGLVDFLQIAPAWGQSEITIVASGNNSIVYSIELNGDCP